MKTITTIEEVQAYVTHTLSTELSTLKPSFSRVERKMIIPLITKGIFNELIEAYETADYVVDDMEDPAAELMALVQDVVCNIGQLNMIASGQVHMSDSGIRIASNDEMKTAFQWQINDIKAELQRDGYNGIEDILVCLEENPDSFPSWKTSDAYYQQKDMLINTAVEFDGYFSINKSRRFFLELRYIIKRVELMDVKPILGNDLFALLKTNVASGVLTAKQKELLQKYINPGIALYTIAKGLVEQRIKLDENGASLLFKDNTDTVRQSNAATAEDIKTTVPHLLAEGSAFFAEAQDFITDNIADFEDYVIDLVPQTRYNILNVDGSGFFGV